MNILQTNLKSENTQVSIPKVIHEAVAQLRSAFCQVVKEIKKHHQGEVDRPPTESEQPDEASLEIIDLCKQLVNLILNELGLKSMDLDKIY